MFSDCGEQMAEQIDVEVKQLLDGAYADAKQILSDHRDKLEKVAGILLETETIDGDQFRNVLGLAEATTRRDTGEK